MDFYHSKGILVFFSVPLDALVTYGYWENHQRCEAFLSLWDLVHKKKKYLTPEHMPVLDTLGSLCCRFGNSQARAQFTS